MNNECVEACPDGMYSDSETWTCKSCPSRCKTCFGGDQESQCYNC